MFSHKQSTWQVQTVNTHFEIGYNRDIPIIKKKLRNHSGSITLSVCPYRMYFDPGMFSDNYCQIEVEFKNGIPWHEDSPKKLSCLFHIDDKELSLYLTMLENNLFNLSQDKISLLEGFNQLREFLNLPKQTINYRKIRSALSNNPVTNLQSSLLEGFIGLRK